MGYKKAKSTAGPTVVGSPAKKKKHAVPDPNGNRAERRKAEKEARKKK